MQGFVNKNQIYLYFYRESLVYLGFCTFTKRTRSHPALIATIMLLRIGLCLPRKWGMSNLPEVH